MLKERALVEADVSRLYLNPDSFAYLRQLIPRGYYRRKYPTECTEGSPTTYTILYKHR